MYIMNKFIKVIDLILRRDKNLNVAKLFFCDIHALEWSNSKIHWNFMRIYVLIFAMVLSL